MKIRLLSIALLLAFTFPQLDLLGQGTGGTLTTSGIRKIHTFSTSSSITPVVGLDSVGLSAMYYTIVGGGGGGATGTTPIGGGGGEVVNLNAPGVNYRSTQSITVTIGTGGAAGAIGNTSSISFTNSGGTAVSLAANGGNSNGSAFAMGSSRASDTTALPVTFGPGSSVTSSGSYGYGGGAGNSSLGGNGTSNTGGNGGRGRSVLNAENVRVTYGGGGGGCGKSTLGLGGSGGGGAATSTSNVNGISGTVNSGGGGGAADGGGSAVGGSGGSGVVIVSYEGFDYFSGTAPGAWTYLNSINHTSGAAVKFFSNATLSSASNWSTDDIYVKTNVTLTISGAVSCRNLYCDGSVVISGGGSLTVNNTFFANKTQTIPTATIKNLQILGTSNTTALSVNTSLTGTLTINAGNKLSLSGFTLTVVSLAGTGTITGHLSSGIIYSGSSNSTLYMDGTTDKSTNNLKFLELSTSNAFLTLGNKLHVYGNSGNALGEIVLGTGNTSKLVSNTSFGTGATPVDAYLNLHVTVVTENLVNAGIPSIVNFRGGIFEGEAMVESYLADGYRSYRQFGFTVDSSVGGLSMNQITDDIDIYAEVVSGSTYSGRSAGTNINGFLQANTTTTKPSSFNYREDLSPKWQSLKYEDNVAVKIPRGVGILVFLRPSGSGASGSYGSQIVDVEGSLNCTANVSTTVYKGTSVSGSVVGYNLVANPYQSYLNWEAFSSDASNSIITNSSTTPSSNTASIKRYDRRTKNYVDGIYKNGGNWKNENAATISPNIDPGDAFFINVSAGSSTVTFKPTHLSVTRETGYGRWNKVEIDTQSYTDLNLRIKTDSDSTVGDVLNISFASWGRDNTFNGFDIKDLSGNCLDISVISAEQILCSFKAVSNLKPISIPLSFNTCINGNYTFDFSEIKNNSIEGEIITLFDSYLNKEFDISDQSKYKFEVNNNSDSKGVARFRINYNISNLSSNNLISDNPLLFPNPIVDNHEVQLTSANANIIGYSLFTLAGKSIISKKLSNLSSSASIAVEFIPDGIYFLEIITENGHYTKKLVLNRSK